jgi:hypothetical protein
MALAIASALASHPAGAKQVTVRASLTESGLQVRTNFVHGNRCLSGDGRSAVCATDPHSHGVASPALVEVFTYRCASSDVELASASSSGAPAMQGIPQFMGLSGDGRFVVFASSSPNLVSPDTNNNIDTFLRDTLLGTIEGITLLPSGDQVASDPHGLRVSHSGDLVFLNVAEAIHPADSNDEFDVYAWTRATRSFQRVSLGSAGNELTYPFAYPAQYGGGVSGLDISADGRFAVFGSFSPDVVAQDSNMWIDVFCRDLVAGTTELIDYDVSGAIAAGGAQDPAISGDGRFVAFSSTSPNLVPGVGLVGLQVYVRDRILGITELVSVGMSGTPGDASSFWPIVSFDGRFVGFQSMATDLVGGDTNAIEDAFVRDRTSRTTIRVSLTSAGAQSSGSAGFTAGIVGISYDGRRVLLTSFASDFVPGDSNGSEDLFIRDLGAPNAPVASYCSAKPNSTGCVPTISTAGEPDLSGTTAFFITSVGTQNQRLGALSWSFAAAPPPYTSGMHCVAAPLRILTRQSTLGSVLPANDCSGWLSYPLSPSAMSAHGWIPGSTVYCQFLVRDPASSGLSMSRGMSFVVY